MNKNYALNELMAEKMASDFFRKEFNHSGKVDVEKRTSGTCACGEALAIEFYSKEDPGMDDTYTVIICESCYNNDFVFTSKYSELNPAAEMTLSEAKTI